MTAIIWKFNCPITDTVHIEMPARSEVLSVQDQCGAICMWVKVYEPNAHKVVRTFKWFGTGHTIPVEGEYVTTVQTNGGALVFHLFDFSYT